MRTISGTRPKRDSSSRPMAPRASSSSRSRAWTGSGRCGPGPAIDRAHPVRARRTAGEGAHRRGWLHDRRQGHRAEGPRQGRRHRQWCRGVERGRAAGPEAGDRAERPGQVARWQECRHRDGHRCRGHEPSGGPRHLLPGTRRRSPRGSARRGSSASARGPASRSRSAGSDPASSSASATAASGRRGAPDARVRGRPAPGDTVLADGEGARGAGDRGAGWPGRERQAGAPGFRQRQRRGGLAPGARRSVCRGQPPAEAP